MNAFIRRRSTTLAGELEVDSNTMVKAMRSLQSSDDRKQCWSGLVVERVNENKTLEQAQ
jgi:hypothetical protein